MRIRLAKTEDSPRIAEVHVTSWRETYPGIVPQTYLDTLDIEEKQNFWERALVNGTQLYVAESQRGIVGIASGGAYRGDAPDIKGELYLIYLLAEAKRQGIGRALFNAVKQQMMPTHHPFCAYVLADNPACYFYRAMGGEIIGDHIEDIGGKPLKEFQFLFR
jgi:GNAT superfamily N-acetyltransferase